MRETRGMPRGIVPWALCLMAALGACAGNVEAEPVNAPTEATDAQGAGTGEAAIAALTPDPERAEPDRRAAIEAEIDDDPRQLMALEPETLGALLGPPGLRRIEARAEVWQYAAPDCVLDIYLYPPTSAGDAGEIEGAQDARRAGAASAAHRVTYYEIRGPQGGPADARRCFGGFVRTWRIVNAEARDR